MSWRRLGREWRPPQDFPLPKFQVARLAERARAPFREGEEPHSKMPRPHFEPREGWPVLADLRWLQLTNITAKSHVLSNLRMEPIAPFSRNHTLRERGQSGHSLSFLCGRGGSKERDSNHLPPPHHHTHTHTHPLRAIASENFTSLQTFRPKRGR